MSAREEILDRIRSALASAPPPPSISRDYRGDVPDVDLLTLFVERVQDYRAVVERCTPESVEERVAVVLAGASCVVPDGLGFTVLGAVADSGQSALELDGIDAVVTRVAVGIALTGTVVLDHGPGQGRRALSLVPDLLVCVVHANQVVHGVREALERLDPARPQTWISGPSATSDIELSRVEGVHGPRRLHVLLVAG